MYYERVNSSTGGESSKRPQETLNVWKWEISSNPKTYPIDHRWDMSVWNHNPRDQPDPMKNTRLQYTITTDTRYKTTMVTDLIRQCVDDRSRTFIKTNPSLLITEVPTRYNRPQTSTLYDTRPVTPTHCRDPNDKPGVTHPSRSPIQGVYTYLNPNGESHFTRIRLMVLIHLNGELSALTHPGLQGRYLLVTGRQRKTGPIPNCSRGPDTLPQLIPEFRPFGYLVRKTVY